MAPPLARIPDFIQGVPCPSPSSPLTKPTGFQRCTALAASPIPPSVKNTAWVQAFSPIGRKSSDLHPQRPAFRKSFSHPLPSTPAPASSPSLPESRSNSPPPSWKNDGFRTPSQALPGHLFCFFNKARDKVKILHFDTSGFCLYLKRLEKERFHLGAFAEAKRHRRYEFQRAAA